MPDSIPPQAWLLLTLVMLGIGPATYVWRYLIHPTRPRDITQPPDNLSWRSEGHFYRSLAISLALVAVGIFIFTLTAENFARSDAFFPSLLGAIGTYALGATIQGWRNGRIEPLLRGLSRTFDREEQPARYWASLGWNAILGCALLAGAAGIAYESKVSRCDDSEDKELLPDALEACDTLLAQDGLSEESRADLLAARGRVHHRLGADSRAKISTPR